MFAELTSGPEFETERVQYMNANHKDICKFDSPQDPSYLTLKKAIASATQDIIKDGEFDEKRHIPHKLTR